MIQINLLPDVKTKYIKAQRNKRLIVLSSLTISAASLGVLVLLIGIVYGVQKTQIVSLTKDIKKNGAKLVGTEDLDKVLTIQNQLNVLPKLHADKPVVSRIFTYLPQITPNDVQISSFMLSYIDNTVSVSGSAKSFEAVNKYVDTLKFTKYKTGEGDSAAQSPVFNTVVLATFGRSDKEASYTINMKVDPAIFSSANQKLALVVPSIISTRSQTEQPTALFKEDQ